MFTNKLTKNQNLLISFFGLIIISIVFEHIQLGNFGQVYKFGYYPLKSQFGIYLGNLLSFTFFSFLLGVIKFLFLKIKKKKIPFKKLIYDCNYLIIIIHILLKLNNFY